MAPRLVYISSKYFTFLAKNFPKGRAEMEKISDIFTNFRAGVGTNRVVEKKWKKINNHRIISEKLSF